MDSIPALDKAPIFKELTQCFKLFLEGAQFQKIQILSQNDDKLLIYMDFYPSPRKLLWASNSEKRQYSLGFKPDLKVLSSHPVQSFARAHLVGARISQVLLPDEGCLTLVFEHGQRFECVLKRKTVEIKITSANQKFVKKEIELGSVASRTEVSSKQNKRWRRLIKNVESDQAKAQMWLAEFLPVCEQLRQSPMAWNDSSNWTSEQLTFITREVSARNLPKFGAKFIGQAQDLLFAKKRRQERKHKKASARLQELLVAGVEASLSAARGRLPKDAKNPLTRTQKKPGIWVCIDSEIWVRVGKSARENDELFRQAGARDLWFHVRGQRGAHVWLPRGQKGFSKNDEPKSEWLKKACQLAIFNSQASKSESGDVEYTERRYLRKVSGDVGKVVVSRSKSLFVKLDSEFYKMLNIVK